MSNSKSRREGGGQGVEDAEVEQLPWPGKRTSAMPVRRKADWPGKPSLRAKHAARADESESPAIVDHVVAAGGGGPLDVGIRQTVESHVEDAATFAVENRGGGKPVDADLAAKVGSHMGADLSAARIHDDPTTQQATHAMGARAFAYGSDVFLGPGESASDQNLVAHELTHVAQQDGGAALPQRKVAVGDANSPAEQQADQVASQVSSGTLAPAKLIVDGGPLQPGQMLKSSFLDRLKPIVVDVTNHELGRLGSAVACPYIAEAFSKYSGEPASSVEALLHRWIPAARTVRSADELYALIMDRVRAGVQLWVKTKQLPADLAAAEPSLAQAASAAMNVVPSAPQAQRSSLDSLEADLGPGHAADSQLAAPLGAEGAKIHTGPMAAAKAAEHNAVAFAVGQNVVMGANAPQAGTLAGDALLAHEFAHTAQQRDAATDPIARKKPIGEEDQTAERNADRAAGGAMSERLTTLGNFAGKVGDVMRTGLQLQRCSESATTQVDAATYLKNHEVEIASTAAQEIATLQFATGEPSVMWTPGGEQKFATTLSTLLNGPATPDLQTMIRPDKFETLIDESRIKSDGSTSAGPDSYFNSVGLAFGNSLARRTGESLKREVPRYVQARLASSGEPTPSEVVASHPIDPLIVTALAIGGVLSIDRAAFAKRHPDLAGPPRKATDLRAVHLEPTGKTGTWWRLRDPMDATPEEVANAMFHSPTEAFRLEVAHPLYRDLQVNDGKLPEGDADLAHEAALAQASTVGIGAHKSPDKVIAQLRANATMIRTSLVDVAVKFDLEDRLVPIYSAIRMRADQLETAGATEIQKWDAQSQAQNAILVGAAHGLEACYNRLKIYAVQSGQSDKFDPGISFLPEVPQHALRVDASMWVDAIVSCDLVTTAQGKLQQAMQHSATVEIDLMENSLDATRAAAYNAKADPSAGVNADFKPEEMSQRELDLRKRLGQMRAQVLADPSKLDAGVEKTAEDTRQLEFESNVVLQAEQVDGLWRILDGADGFWAHVTFDSSTLKAKKAQGTIYYNDWRSVYSMIKDAQKDPNEASKSKKMDAARKKYESVCGDPAFQRFLSEAQQAAQNAQDNAMIAKLVAMVVITVASMGVGTIVEGVVGGGAAVAEGTTAVTTGLGMGRTAGAVAGFIAETSTFTIASNVAFSNDHSATAILTEFGKNIVLFGAMRGMGKAFEAAGLAKVIEVGAKPGATVGAKVAGGAVQVSRLVAMGGVGVLSGIIEAKVREATGGRNLTDGEVKDIIEMNVAQTIIMVIVGRVMESPLKTLRLKGAYMGSTWRMASQAAEHLEGLGGSYHGKPVTKDQLSQIVAADRAQLELERQAFEEVKAKAAAEGKSTADIDAHLEEIDRYATASRVIDQKLSMIQRGPNQFEAPRAKIQDIIDTHKANGHEPRLVATDPSTHARTWEIDTHQAGELPFYITEVMPEWAGTPAGKRIISAAQAAGVDDSVLFNLPQPSIDALVQADASIARNDVDGAKAILDKAKLDPVLRSQLEPDAVVMKGGSGKEWVEHLKSRLAPDARAHLDAELTGRTPKQVMDSFDGDFVQAIEYLSTPGGDKPPPIQDTVDKFGVGQVPKSGPARWAYIEDPAHWSPERAALHDRLITKAKQQAQQFADAVKKGDPTIYAMRGNTAAGKTRAVSSNVPELAGAMSSTKSLPHRSVNPDNFKADLIAETPGMTSTQVHSESSMLATRLEKELLGLKTSDGKEAASILIDKRLATLADVQAYAKMAKDSGRKFVLYDVDAPLEVSLAGVLERVPGGADPLPPFEVVAKGFEGVRENRAGVIDMFDNPEVGSYVLYGTKSTGERVEIASVVGGKRTITNPDLYAVAIAAPGTEAQALANQRITGEEIDSLIKDLPPDRAAKVGPLLRKYEGWTWKSALDAHSMEKPKP